MKNIVFLLLPGIVSFLMGCKDEDDKTLFTRLPEDITGVTFRNLLKEENPEFNILVYPYFYNGGGVAVGDINNDSLPDLFFTGNMVKNRLFVNKGAFSFEDITENASVAKKEGWCTGATMVDINEDGWLDIYVCRSGLPNVSYRRNLLFINNHDLTFTESAAAYGLDDPGYSTQASFFDYDKDGDLDMALINQSAPEYSRGNLDYLQQRHSRLDSLLENKLFRNDNGHFTNVTRQAGIASTVFTFSLGISTADINQDGWPDIYVANDFKEPDYYYINNRDGTFTDSLTTFIDHNSLYSMGIDVADYNNDLLPDMIVLDMLSEGNTAQKMHMGADNYTQYSHLFRNGMFYQYMKNSLQKNNGDGTFSEVAQVAGVSATDWSWSPLVADYDNDGLKDLFITNGYKRDNTDVQFVVYSMNQSLQQGNASVDVPEYISHMPGIHLPNYIYKNSGSDRFENKIKDWGFDHNTFSHGAAYADLDNDGDLDLVTNNTDEYAGVYRNNIDRSEKNNYLKIRLKGSKKNPAGIGTKIYAYAGNDRFYLEQNPVRGYQSSVALDLHLGLGKHQKIDSLYVIWPNDSSQCIDDIKTNRVVTFTIAEAMKPYTYRSLTRDKLFKAEDVLAYKHVENYENDFTRQFLLPHFFSHNGPCMAAGDINADGLEDIFIGGAKGQPGAIFLQHKDQSFTRLTTPALVNDAPCEDISAVFFDADGDKDPDLYVVSGGYEFAAEDPLLQDRLYINKGNGQFTKAVLPTNFSNKRCVRPNDIDGDGDLDLFIGGGVVPGQYPLAAASKVYRNVGNGKFEDHTAQFFAGVEGLGIINDAVWLDLNKDGRNDLIIAGEWMPLRALINNGNSFTDVSAQYFPFASAGWWNRLMCDDLDGDGDGDLIAGNYGLNAPVKVTSQQPLQLYYGDIDGNGSIDPLMTHYISGVSYPLVSRDDMIGQVPSLKKKFNDYGSYSKATIHEIVTPEQLKKCALLSVNELTTVYLENTGSTFVKKELPIEAQYAPVHAITSADINGDGKKDLVLAGNNQYNRIYLAKHDANHGMVFMGDGKGNFTYLPQYKSGLKVRGDVRSVLSLDKRLFFGVNNGEVKTYKIVQE